MTQAIEWVAYQGRSLYDQDGNVIGTIEEFYIDRADGEPVWALVYTVQPACACHSCRCAKPGCKAPTTTYKSRSKVMRFVTRPRSRPARSYRATRSNGFTGTMTCPTPKGAPELMTNRETMIQTARTPTTSRASSPGYSGSFTATGTRSRGAMQDLRRALTQRTDRFLEAHQSPSGLSVPAARGHVSRRCG